MDIEKFKKCRKIAFIIIGCLFVGYSVYMFRRLNNELKGNTIHELKVAPDEYNALFKDDIKKDLIINSTLLFDKRPPISLFTYKKIYSIEITKINVKPNMSLKEDIFETSREAEIAGNTVYIPFSEKDIVVNYKSSLSNETSKISIVLSGDDVNIKKSNNVACYYLNAKTISVSYDFNQVSDIYIKSKSISPFTGGRPISVMFFKKSRFVYFILMTAKSQKTILSIKDLSNLIK